MIEVIPVQDKRDQQKVCELCKTDYRAGDMAYMARDKDSGMLLGTVQFAIRGKFGHITSIDNAESLSDPDALFILGRSAMNFLELCGIREAYFDVDDAKLAVSLGFKLGQDGSRIADLKKIFESPCQCGENPAR